MEALAPAPLDLDESRPAQHLHMLGDGGTPDRHVRSQLRRGTRPGAKLQQKTAAQGMGERVENVGDLVVGRQSRVP